MKNQYLFLIVIIWVLVVVSGDLIQNTILSNYFISPLENQESGLHMCVKAFHSKDMNRWI